ncbi:MAG TPA: hypothetical protein ENF45_03900, partial [Bacteroidetes bacterium]|nr:hypothetical protein [Bacteroidota bacterium]
MEKNGIKRKMVLKAVVIAAVLAVVGFNVSAAEKSDSKYKDQSPGYTISAYYWPDYHVDPRNEKWFGPGWTEWEIIKWARPRFKGHNQPRVPLWGYEDESDPKVMAKKIDAAAKYGVDVLIFDWYYYNDGSFLRAALDKGFLKADNNHKVKFALMWANHDMPDVFPAKLYQCYPNWKILIPGGVTRETFDKMVDDIIEKYFKHPSYWLIDGCPYFSIYDLDALMKGLGGPEKTKEALADFRAKARKAGFPDVHLNVVLKGAIMPGAAVLKDQKELASGLGFQSLGSYTWAHHVPFPDFPKTKYTYVRNKAIEHWRKTVEKFDIPYYPNVTCGWDSTPRACRTNIYVNKGYPYLPVIVGNTPEEFKKSLVEMKKFLDSGGNKRK